MKTLKLLLLFLSLTGTVFAQHVANEEMSNIVQNDAEKVAIVNDDNIETIIRQRPKRIDKHEFRVGVGSLSLASIMFMDGIGLYHDDAERDFRHEMIAAESYWTKARFVGNYSLSYTYHSRRWLQVGATLTFGVITQARRDNITNKKVSNENQYAGSAMATVRFVYLYREKVQLYSGLSVGMAGGTGLCFPWIDPTFIGCSFGKNLFGFAEIGGGLSGWGRVGIGYRFDSKKKTYR